MQPNKRVSTSIIVPCRDECQHIGSFLDSVFHQELDGIDVEVLVADGMSEDGTRLILREYAAQFSALRIIDNPGKIVSAGLNAAIREAKGEIIVRMDAHSKYAPDYVRSCVEVLHETNADNVGGPALTCADGYLAQAIAHAYHTRFACGGAKFHDPRCQGPVDTVPYGCWRKSTLERIGLFDEKLVRGQDDELNRRIVAAGGTVWLSPRIISWYRPRASLSKLFGQYFQYGFWKVAASRKYHRIVSVRSLMPGLSLLVGILLLLCAAVAGHPESIWGRNTFLTLWLGLVSLYLMASLASAFLVARRNGWIFLPVMPLVFATYHFSYALGFLLALVYRPGARDRPTAVGKALTVITR